MEEGGKRIMLAVHKYVNKTEKRVVGFVGRWKHPGRRNAKKKLILRL